MGDGSLTFCTDGTGTYMYDDVTGVRTEGTAGDLRDVMRLFDALPEVDYAWPSISARDLDPRTAGLEIEAISLACFTKHLQDEVREVAHVAPLLEIFEAVAGGSLWDRPVFSTINCTIAPLQHEREMTEATMALVKAGVPVLILPMPLIGTTSPMTVLGTCIVNMAELLSAVVLFQLAQPGCGLISGVGAAAADMRSGGYLCGTPEVGLINAICIEMSRFYGLPVTGSAVTSDAKASNLQAGAEGMLTGLACALAGADSLLAFGLMDGAETVSLAKIVMDCDVVGMIQRFVRDDPVDETTALVGDIAEVGVGGHFLSRRSTRRFLAAGGAVAAAGVPARHVRGATRGEVLRPRRRAGAGPAGGATRSAAARRRHARDRRRHRALRTAGGSSGRPGALDGGGAGTMSVEVRQTSDLAAVRRLGIAAGLDDSERGDEGIIAAWGAYDGERGRPASTGGRTRGTTEARVPVRRRQGLHPRADGAHPRRGRRGLQHTDAHAAPGRGGRRRRRRGAHGEAAVGADRALPAARSRQDVLLAGRDPAYDCRVGADGMLYTSDGAATYMLDDLTGDRHEGTREDLATMTRLYDAVPEIDFVWATITPGDVDARVGNLEMARITFDNCRKHLQDEVRHPDQAPVMIELLEAIAGASLRERPIWSATNCTIAPLQHDAEMTEAHVLMARAGCPIFVLPMPQMGTTGPMSVLGTSILNMAELLSAVVLFQLAAPGCAMVSAVGSAVAEMRTGLYLSGAPEDALINMICIEMSRYYGLRSQGSAVSCDAKACNLQAGAEGMLTGMASALAGADVMLAFGLHGQRPDGQPGQDGARRRHGERHRALHARRPRRRGARARRRHHRGRHRRPLPGSQEHPALLPATESCGSRACGSAGRSSSTSGRRWCSRPGRGPTS